MREQQLQSTTTCRCGCIASTAVCHRQASDVRHEVVVTLVYRQETLEASKAAELTTTTTAAVRQVLFLEWYEPQ